LNDAIGNFFAEMTYVPGGWYELEGWNDVGIARAQEKHWPVIVRSLEGPGPLGISHLPWDTSRELRHAHNVMMSYGYVLARAAHKRDRLTMLDWGGSLGHYNLYTKALLPEVEVEYHCYELPSLCRAGKRVQPEVSFFDNEKDLAPSGYDLVISSSSLHYVKDWRAQVPKLAALTRDYLYVARLQCIRIASTYLTLHRVYREGYQQFLSWCINRDEFVNCVRDCGLELIREFVFTEPWCVRGAPEKPESRGFLFCRRAPDK